MPERTVSVEEVLAAAVRWLDASGLSYAVVGGLALGAWAEPRATADVDVIVAATPTRVLEALPRARDFGFRLDEKKTRAQAQRQGMCRLFYGDRHFDVVCGTSSVELCAIERALRLRILEQEAAVATAEDVLLFKLLAGRPQDLADIEKLALSRKGKLDVEYLRRTARQMARDLLSPKILRRLEDLLARK
ncbi:MAG: hypothetical protein HYZ53_07270 [Planctomycetes bacterium]|nr:hypothetical protein [Planctomycetota bacterium]